MKIVIAPDSWKESLSALEVASAIEQGFREIYPDAEYVRLPVADGGEGTVEAMVAATGGHQVPLTVTGPLGEPVEAFYGLSGDRQCAFIEMAAASGLESVPPAQRNPLLTTSGAPGSSSAMRWTLVCGRSLLALAAARPMTAAPAWRRRWGRNC